MSKGLGCGAPGSFRHYLRAMRIITLAWAYDRRSLGRWRGCDAAAMGLRRELRLTAARASGGARRKVSSGEWLPLPRDGTERFAARDGNDVTTLASHGSLVHDGVSTARAR